MSGELFIHAVIPISWLPTEQQIALAPNRLIDQLIISLSELLESRVNYGVHKMGIVCITTHTTIARVSRFSDCERKLKVPRVRHKDTARSREYIIGRHFLMT